jgi:phospholipid/cholesterol/gamma-HCH transport system substrate-binding protein
VTQPRSARLAGPGARLAGPGARLAGPVALLIALAALAVILAGSGSAYVLHARFYDAGQLVGGDLVTVGGHQVGSVGAVTLSPHGLADVELDITDSSITPLRGGTIATIGQTSLTGVANRFVGLSPGAGPPLPSGSVLAPTQTRGIVDLDTLLDALTPRVRASLENLLHSGAYLVAQPTASQFNHALEYSNPAFSQTAQLGQVLAANRAALVGLVSATARVSRALAAHSQQLGGAVTHTAAVLREIASERSALADAISRAPAVLSQGTRVLGDLGGTLRVLDPALIRLRPVAVRLSGLLRALLPAAAHALPTIRALSALVPGAETALERFPPVERVAVPAVESLRTLLTVISPSLSALRPYAPDVVGGFFNGVGGADTGPYDANGHYLYGEVAVQGGGSSLTGLLNLLGSHSGTLGPFHGERTRLLAPCPGGGGPSAPDRSNPWTTPHLLPGAPVLCRPADDQR